MGGRYQGEASFPPSWRRGMASRSLGDATGPGSWPPGAPRPSIGDASGPPSWRQGMNGPTLGERSVPMSSADEEHRRALRDYERIRPPAYGDRYAGERQRMYPPEEERLLLPPYANPYDENDPRNPGRPYRRQLDSVYRSRLNGDENRDSYSLDALRDGRELGPEFPIPYSPRTDRIYQDQGLIPYNYDDGLYTGPQQFSPRLMNNQPRTLPLRRDRTFRFIELNDRWEATGQEIEEVEGVGR